MRWPASTIVSSALDQGHRTGPALDRESRGPHPPGVHRARHDVHQVRPGAQHPPRSGRRRSLADELTRLQSQVPADSAGHHSGDRGNGTGPAARRAVRDVRARTAGVRVDRPGPSGNASRRPAGRGEGSAPGHRPRASPTIIASWPNWPLWPSGSCRSCASIVRWRWSPSSSASSANSTSAANCGTSNLPAGVRGRSDIVFPEPFPSHLDRSRADDGVSRWHSLQPA